MAAARPCNEIVVAGTLSFHDKRKARERLRALFVERRGDIAVHACEKVHLTAHFFGKSDEKRSHPMLKIVALSVAVLLTGPALARESALHAHAQAPLSEGEEGLSRQRLQALEDCSKLEEKFPQRTYGSDQIQIYRACMAKYGQVE